MLLPLDVSKHLIFMFRDVFLTFFALGISLILIMVFPKTYGFPKSVIFRLFLGFLKNIQNAVNIVFFKVMSLGFQDFLSRPETFISGVFWARAGPGDGILYLNILGKSEKNIYREF